MILSFAYTAPQYAAGIKTETRRFWKPKQIEQWQSFFDRGMLIHQAYDKSPRNGGKPIPEAPRFRLVERPFLQPLKEMTAADLKAEGGMCATVIEFAALVQQPLYGQACVIRFRPLRPDGSELIEQPFGAESTDGENKAAFIARLVAAGWPEAEAAAEYANIQRDTEGEP